MIDLTYALNEGTSNLIKWRNRYSPQEYPQKIVLNIFYRRYTMSRIWNRLMQMKKSEMDLENAYKKIEFLYSQTAVSQVAPLLETWIHNNPEEIVGAIHYSDFVPLIQRVQLGSKPAKEELEYSYLYYLLSDKCTLLWAAMCATGIAPLSAITKVTDAVIEPMPLNDYNTLTVGLGQLCVGKFLKDRYNPLP